MGRWEKTKFFVIRHHTGLLVWGLALALALTPLVMRNPYNLGILNLIGLYVIVVLGLNLFIGFAAPTARPSSPPPTVFPPGRPCSSPPPPWRWWPWSWASPP
jgi:threonine/homoserine/homoserine lactone efflux protein